MHDAKTLAYFKDRLEPWVLHMSRLESDKAVVAVKKDLINEAKENSVEACMPMVDERLSDLREQLEQKIYGGAEESVEASAELSAEATFRNDQEQE